MTRTLAISKTIAERPFDEQARAAVEGANWIDWRGRDYGRPESRHQRATGAMKGAEK